MLQFLTVLTVSSFVANEGRDWIGTSRQIMGYILSPYISDILRHLQNVTVEPIRSDCPSINTLKVKGVVGTSGSEYFPNPKKADPKSEKIFGFLQKLKCKNVFVLGAKSKLKHIPLYIYLCTYLLLYIYRLQKLETLKQVITKGTRT